MNRIIGYVLAALVFTGIAYAIYVYAPQLSGTPATPTITETDSVTATETKAGIISESTATYRIEVHYPQFGIAAADEKIKAVVDRAVAAFKEYPANPPGSAVPQNELTGSFSSAYVGPDIVSVALSISEYTGGAHPNTAIIGVNVDRTTGKELSLNDALALIGKSLEEVAQVSLEALKATLGDDIIAPEGASPTVENYSTFLISEDRVTFVFNNYQVAPYSAGQQYVWFKRVK